jgi:REP element-mobilizing transposase RayT
MTPGQRAAAEALLQFSLSEVGYQKAHNLMHLETVVRQMDRFVSTAGNVSSTTIQKYIESQGKD